MYEVCHPDCLFLREPSCNGCERCTYCGRLLNRSGRGSKLTWDHVLPWISGCRTVVPACERCNKSKWALGLKDGLDGLKTIDQPYGEEQSSTTGGREIESLT